MIRFTAVLAMDVTECIEHCAPTHRSRTWMLPIMQL